MCGLNWLRLSLRKVHDVVDREHAAKLVRLRRKDSVAWSGLEMTSAICVVLWARSRLHSFRHWRRIRSDFSDEVRKFEQVAKTNVSAKMPRERGSCCFPVATE